MIVKRFFLLIIFTLSVFLVYAQHPPQDKNWDTLYMDDFNSFNTNKWHKSVGVHNAGKIKEDGTILEEITFQIPGNVYVENGKLVIVTKEENSPYCSGNGNGCKRDSNGIHSYTSGAIVSNELYSYGNYEIYAKLPISSGYWSGFWFWNNSPDNQTSNCWYNEIDVIELNGGNPNYIPTNVHSKFCCPLDSCYDNTSQLSIFNSYDTGWHWYGITWDANNITWYVDRKQIRRIPNNVGGIGINHDMYIIMNSWLFPPEWGENFEMDDNTIFPNYMYIDQFNAYQLTCDKGAVVNEIPNYNTFNYGIKKSISLSSVSSLPSGQNVSLRATDFIELKNGFEVPLGAELYLDINTCE